MEKCLSHTAQNYSNSLSCQNRFKESRQSDRSADGSNEWQSDEQTNRPVPVGLVPLIRLNVSLALLQMAE